MPDQPDETQKQQRRSTALPPFFAPRTARPTTPSQSGTATPPRRTSQLFTPPGMPKQQPAPFKTSLATPRVTPFAAPVVPSVPAIDASYEPPPLPAMDAPAPEFDEPAVSSPLEAAGAAPDLAANPARDAAHAPNAETARGGAEEGIGAPANDRFVIEQYESPPISLRATGEQGVVSDDASMSFQVFDDASRLLERGARPVPPEAGGLEIERAEVVFELPATVSPLEVESFWAAQMMPAAEPAREAATPPLGSEPVAEVPAAEVEAPVAPPEAPYAPTAPRETEGERADALPPASAASDPMPVPSWLEDVPVDTPRYAMPDATPPAPAEQSEPDDADEALAEAFAEPAPNESVPRWATPRMAPAVEERASSTARDPWGMPAVPAPPDELAAALAWPDSGLRARTPAMGVTAQGARADTSHELAASAEGWPLSVSGRPGMPDTVAEALERIAQRVRAGEVPLPADLALAKSDESALALTLAALLRAAAAPRA